MYIDCTPSTATGTAMPLFSAEERHFAEAVGRLAHCNPFLPERIACERELLGAAFDPHEAEWNLRPGDLREHPNLDRLLVRCETVLEKARKRLTRGVSDLGHDQPLYEDLLWTV